MGIDFDERERGAQQDEIVRARADRVAEMTPTVGVLTPRELVQAYVRSAMDSLCCGDGRSAQNELASALGVLAQPTVVDGAAVLRSAVDQAEYLLEERDYAGVGVQLEEMRSVLEQPVRAPEFEVKPASSDEQESRRQAVRAAFGVGGAQLTDETVDAMIAAALAGF